MNKTKVIAYLPYASLSGYGLRSYDLLRSLIELKSEDWDLSIVSMQFGRSPQRDLDVSDPINKKIIDQTIGGDQVQNKQWDIAIFCTVPSELVNVKIAKFQVLFTASIESTLCSSEFIQGCNSLDLIVCSSQHGANVLLNSTYDQRDQNNNIVGQLKVTKPVVTMFEGIDVTKFDRKNPQVFDFKTEGLDVTEENLFLVSGMWLQGAFTEPYSHDRKHIGTTIKVFLETFKDQKSKPGLVLKVNCGTYSHMDLDYTKERIDEIRKTVKGDLPNIYLIHGNLPEEKLIGLYQNPKIKALIAVGAEGWGRGIPEFICSTSKPAIVPSYGGVLDYIKPEFTLSVGGTVQPVHKSSANQFLLETAQIYYPDLKQLSAAMSQVLTNAKDLEEKSKRQAHYIRTTFTTEKMTEKLDEILKAHIPEFPKVVQLKLPKLSQISLPKLNKVD